LKKETAEAIARRADGKCEWCGDICEGSLHHVIGGNGKRKACERAESVIHVCNFCHYGKYGATDNSDTNYAMKRELQAYYLLTHTEDETRELMGGKLYLVDGEIRKDVVCRWMST